MAHVFLSYSHKDSHLAQDIAARLHDEGLSLWIDQEGINVATIWSTEIANAIRECKAFLLLQSEFALGSSNVQREIALAVQFGKPIVVLPLSKCEIPSLLTEALLDAEQVNAEDLSHLFSVLNSHGVERVTKKQVLAEKTDQRKVLMVMPFLDHSPNKDNDWFTDGIVTELIATLSQLRGLRVIDWLTTKDFKLKEQPVGLIADALHVRYFVQGSVRKFGDQYKISVTLFDAVDERHLWEDTLKGEFADIFELQEAIAQSVVEGLRIHLLDDVHHRLRTKDRGTDNPEAYEAWLQSLSYYDRHDRLSFDLALEARRRAAILDPNFIEAHLAVANSLVEFYRQYDRSPALLDEAEAACAQVERVDPMEGRRLAILSRIAIQRKDFGRAEALVEAFVKLCPNDYESHYAMAVTFQQRGKLEIARDHYEKSLALDNPRWLVYWNLCITCDALGETERRAYWAKRAIPIFERRLKLDETNEYLWVWLANFYYFAQDEEAARMLIRTMPESTHQSPAYDLACLADNLKDRELTLKLLTRAVDLGFLEIEALKTGWPAMSDEPRFVELVKRVEERVQARVTEPSLA
jgi:TolB-like protein